MRITICFLICFLWGIASVWAQPKVTAVAQGADFSAILAPGMLASVIGTGFAPAAISASSVPLPTTLSNVSVNVNGRAVPLTFANASQINFQLPYGTATGTASLTVTNNGQVSNAISFPVAAYAPGVFQYGAGHGVIQNQDYALNSAASPAVAGSFVIVYLTGIGITNPTVADGIGASSAPLAQAIPTTSATIAGARSNVVFIGLTPGNVGLAQANIQIPALAIDGEFPLVVQLGVVSSKPVLISVKGTSSASLPDGVKCISGQVDSVTFSLQYKTPGLADEVIIGGTKLCAKCDVKPPIYVEMVSKLEEASTTGIRVDACYDSAGAVNLLRMRP